MSYKNDEAENQGILQSKVIFNRARDHLNILKNSKELNSRYIKKRELPNVDSFTSSESALVRTSKHLKLVDSKHSGESELVNWKKHFHFASFPLFTFGNWIPFVMARWPCLGTGCGLLQVAFKNSKGK